ncbi:MAG: cyclic nucleotide-binding domain-containing protein [Pseudomonadota bacterium]|nr:cyclic nucleotide-binding domain-containing protein [Pseudomonadota bacterium]
MEPYEVNTSTALRGLMSVIREGGAQDALPCRLDNDQWACLAPYLQPVPVPTGQVPIRQGDKDRTLFFIESGSLTVHREDSRGRMQLAVLAPGTVVGEGAFFSAQPRNATVVATRDSHLWALKHPRFLELSARQPTIALELALACGAVVVIRHANATMRIAVT